MNGHRPPKNSAEESLQIVLRLFGFHKLKVLIKISARAPVDLHPGHLNACLWTRFRESVGMRKKLFQRFVANARTSVSEHAVTTPFLQTPVISATHCRRFEMSRARRSHLPRPSCKHLRKFHDRRCPAPSEISAGPASLEQVPLSLKQLQVPNSRMRPPSSSRSGSVSSCERLSSRIRP